jgi:hypothetical protein
MGKSRHVAHEPGAEFFYDGVGFVHTPEDFLDPLLVRTCLLEVLAQAISNFWIGLDAVELPSDDLRSLLLEGMRILESSDEK